MAIWKVSPWMEDLCLYVSLFFLCNFAFQVNELINQSTLNKGEKTNCDFFLNDSKGLVFIIYKTGAHTKLKFAKWALRSNISCSTSVVMKENPS